MENVLHFRTNLSSTLSSQEIMLLLIKNGADIHARDNKSERSQAAISLIPPELLIKLHDAEVSLREENKKHQCNYGIVEMLQSQKAIYTQSISDSIDKGIKELSRPKLLR